MALYTWQDHIGVTLLAEALKLNGIAAVMHSELIDYLTQLEMTADFNFLFLPNSFQQRLLLSAAWTFSLPASLSETFFLRVTIPAFKIMNYCIHSLRYLDIVMFISWAGIFIKVKAQTSHVVSTKVVPLRSFPSIIYGQVYFEQLLQH